MASGMLVCTSCGKSFGPFAENARARAAEIKKRTKLEIVTCARGSRSEKATIRRQYRKYRKGAQRRGWDSVAHRFAGDRIFRQQMQDQGWTERTIGEIDEGAAAPPDTGYRTKEQIRETTREVYRGKEFATEDEKWDKAYKWTAAEDSEYRHWKRAKKHLAKGSWWQSSSSSSKEWRR